MRRFLCVVVLTIAAVVAGGSSATAAQRATATGTWDCSVAATYSESPQRPAGPNKKYSWLATGCVYAGDLSGTFLTYGTDVVKRDESFTTRGSGIVCTGCTLAGKTGDFTGVQSMRGKKPEDFRGTVTVRIATGDLAGLRARIRFETTGDSQGTYTIRYSFKP